MVKSYRDVSRKKKCLTLIAVELSPKEILDNRITVLPLASVEIPLLAANMESMYSEGLTEHRAGSRSIKSQKVWSFAQHVHEQVDDACNSMDCQIRNL